MSHTQAHTKSDAVELGLLLDGIRLVYGYDFRDYARSSLVRRLKNFCQEEKLESFSAAQALVLHNPEAMTRLVESLVVNVTSMFRDAVTFQTFRDHVIPRLATYPFLRFWVAGCSTGEEALSLAIVLHEANLLAKSRIYATDISVANLAAAKRGVVPLRSMMENTQNYISAGGTQDFSGYYSAKFDSAIFKKYLREKISFAHHDLVTGKSFNEFHVVFCRNVMIYFDKSLQNHVIHLLLESLVPYGYLSIGLSEQICPMGGRIFSELQPGSRVFQVSHKGGT